MRKSCPLKHVKLKDYYWHSDTTYNARRNITAWAAIIDYERHISEKSKKYIYFLNILVVKRQGQSILASKKLIWGG